MATAGTLDGNIRNILNRNSREFSSIEGNILSTQTDKSKAVKTLLVTSCTRGEGKTLSSISIAYGLNKETNLKVLLVDGNLRSPRLHEHFNVAGEPGLSDFVLKDEGNVFKETEYENVMLMPHGSSVSNPLDVFRSPQFGAKVEILKGMFDYVVFDGSAVLGSSDMTVAARHFDGVLIVLECEKTKWEVIQLAIDKITKLRGNVIGAVMNRRKFYIPKVLYGKI